MNIPYSSFSLCFFFLSSKSFFYSKSSLYSVALDTKKMIYFLIGDWNLNSLRYFFIVEQSHNLNTITLMCVIWKNNTPKSSNNNFVKYITSE
jgi:hypothetical protein